MRCEMLPVKVIASEWMTPRYPEGRIEEMVADSIGLRCFSKKILASSIMKHMKNYGVISVYTMKLEILR